MYFGSNFSAQDLTWVLKVLLCFAAVGALALGSGLVVGVFWLIRHIAFM